MTHYNFDQTIESLLTHIERLGDVPPSFTVNETTQWDIDTMMRALFLAMRQGVELRHDQISITCSLRAALFDHIMDVLDTLSPHKNAWVIVFSKIPHKSFTHTTSRFICRVEETNRVLLDQALHVRGVKLNALQTLGIYPLYHGLFTYTFWNWSRDHDPSMAKTMANLDQSLGMIPGL